MRFTEKLLAWYRHHHRDLPWRHTKDPYLVWLSEVILQQTRVEQGLPYYQRISTTFPTIERLAAAEEQEVLKLWQGLGYYSRARNLHTAARQIMERHNGTFPDDYQAIRKLKGAGEYTAAAIASIAFNLPYPVIDGNVIRFISRLHGISDPVNRASARRKILEIVREHIDPLHPGDFNQAVMEFGALVCTPADPACKTCIFRKQCLALALGKTDVWPVKDAAAEVRDLYLHYLVITMTGDDATTLLLNHRSNTGIWKNLYDFPLVPGSEGRTIAKPMNPEKLRKLLHVRKTHYLGTAGPVVHLLTHRKLHILYYRFHVPGSCGIPGIAVPLDKLEQYPVPKAIERYLLNMGSDAPDRAV